MRYIKYTTKNEVGAFETERINATDQEIDWLMNQITSPKKPAQISFKGRLLTTRNIEVLTEKENNNQEGKFYDLDDKEQRQKVYDFENEILAWWAGQPEENRTFELYAESKGLLNLSFPFIAQSGKKRFKFMGIKNPDGYQDFFKLQESLQLLRARREWAKKHEAPMPEENPEGQMAYAALKDEINVEELFG